MSLIEFGATAPEIVPGLLGVVETFTSTALAICQLQPIAVCILLRRRARDRSIGRRSISAVTLSGRRGLLGCVMDEPARFKCSRRVIRRWPSGDGSCSI